MSATESKPVPVSQSHLGLDRSHIDAHGNIQLLSESPKSPSHDSGFSEVDDDRDGGTESQTAELPLSKRKRISLKTRKALHIGADSPPKIVATAPVLADAPDTVSDARLVHDIPKQEDHKFKDLLHNPVDTVTSKVTGQGGQQIAANLIAKEISHGQEVELVLAQDEVLQARSEAAKLLAIEEVDALVKRRQDVFLRWTMDRHVMKVRTLHHESLSVKKPKDFIMLTPEGEGKTDWHAYLNYKIQRFAEEYGGEYIGATSDPPAPSKEVLMPSIERLLVASAPLQELIMTIRRIYRWESRKETATYLGAYAGLWILDLILPGVLLSLLYLLIHRKVRAPTIEDLRKDIKRTENVAETALTLSEFVQKKGEKAWVDPLIETIGPWALVQLSDLANMMEVLRNFYEWRVPSRTGATAGMLALTLIAVVFTPAWLLVRITTLALGFVFFGLFPIGSHFPDYRLLASPIKWAFWKIPTHAEWSIKALQAEGSRHKSSTKPSLPTAPDTPGQTSNSDPLGLRGPPTTAAEEKPLPPIPAPAHTAPSNPDYGSYDCKLDSHFGKLILTAAGVRFKSSIGHKEHFSLQYNEIQKLEKVTRHVEKGLSKAASGGGEDLRIVGANEQEWLFSNVKDRDQVFSQIVGFADVKWQVVW